MFPFISEGQKRKKESRSFSFPDVEGRRAILTNISSVSSPNGKRGGSLAPYLSPKRGSRSE